MDPSIISCFGGKPAEYLIKVGSGVLQQLASDIAEAQPRPSTVVVITDKNVWRWHGFRLTESLRIANAPVPLLYVLPPGESSKTRAVKEAIEDFMLANRCLRDTLVIAFGGGVVGDLAGFVASTYMRGVRVIQVPTTLLAAADSSIGGKTAVDTPGGKNLIGAFHQPVGVYVDLSILVTLPVREISNGMAEVIKAGAIADTSLFELCERHAEAILGREVAAFATVDPTTGCFTSWVTHAAIVQEGGVVPSICAPGTTAVVIRELDLALLQRALVAAIAVKTYVVTTDEREGGLRGILNFGHTVGHGLEAVLQPAMLHGECVSIGMVKEAEASRALGHCSSSLVGRVKRCCKAFNLPVVVPAETASGAGLLAAVDFMLGDKKNARGTDGVVSVKCVLLRGIGEVVSPPFTHAVPLPLLHRLLSSAVAILPVPLIGGAASAAKSPMHLLRVRVPGSKSISNRALLLAGVARGCTTLRGLLASDDTEVMMAALHAIGAKFVWDASDPTAVTVEGNGGVFQLPPPPSSVYVGNAGTASRFLTAIFCLLPLPADGPSVVLCGNNRMHARPIGPLVDALREQGACIEYGGSDGCPPLRFSSGISSSRDSRETLQKRASGASTAPVHRIIFLEGKVSSQYVSAVLMAAPLFPTFRATAATSEPACTSEPEVVELLLAEEHPTSLPYISMTLTVMASFGVVVRRLADNRYIVPLGQYTSPASSIYEIEADASSASYPAAAAALIGRTVELQGVGRCSMQGDAAFPLLLARMGCTVSQDEYSTTVSGPPLGGGLCGIDCDMSNETDCFMTLAVVAAAASGVTRITGIANQRVKECNRIEAMVKEFAKCGIVARELPDGLEITGCGLRGSSTGSAPDASNAQGSLIHCYDDHRIAMSFAVLGLCPGFGRVNSNISSPAIVLDDQACVEKTYPEFWDHLGKFFGCDVIAAPFGDSMKENVVVAGAQPTSNCIVVIGMRGAGKSSLCKAAGASLNIPVYDLDDILLVEFAKGGLVALQPSLTMQAPPTPTTVSGIVAAFGWTAFRQAECELLMRYLHLPATNQCIISCGGGIVECDFARTVLVGHIAAGGIAIEVLRSIADIATDLAQGAEKHADAGRPAYAGGASLEHIFAKRRPWYSLCGSRVFAVPPHERDWAYLRRSFTALVRRSLGDQGMSWRREHVIGSGVDCGRSWPQTSSTSGSVLDCSDGTAFVCLALSRLTDLAKDSTLPDGPSSSATSSSWTRDMEVAAAERLRSITAGCDAVELRVDCLDCCGRSDNDEDILSELAILRKLLHASTLLSTDLIVPPLAPLPIIFTVRSSAEGGRFQGSASDYTRLCVLGAKGGADIVDIEVGRSTLPLSTLLRLAADIEACGAVLLPSTHWPCAPPPKLSDLVAAMSSSLQVAPRAIAVKIVASAVHPAEGMSFHANVRTARAQVAGALATAAVIAVAMGAAGQMTRVCNDVLTPVTHELLGTAAAPGQLTLASVRTLRASLALVRPRAFYLFGRPVQASLSPALHNTGFVALGLPHAYGLVDTDDAAYVVAVLRGNAAPVITPTLIPADSRSLGPLPPFVGGGNITIPLKTEVVPLMDCLSKSAQAIGAVNQVTCVPLPDGGVRLCGDNTDWLGIYWPVLKRLQQNLESASAVLQTSSQCRRVALILGAGGTAMAAAFAAQRLDLIPVFYNRTHSKAQALAQRFSGAAVLSLESESDVFAALAAAESSPSAALSTQALTIVAVLSTLPPTAECTLPEWVLAHHPVVLDAAYTSASTPLLRSATAAGCSTVSGAEMLCSQGLAAFAVWVGKSSCCLPETEASSALPAGVPAHRMVCAVANSLATRVSPKM